MSNLAIATPLRRHRPSALGELPLFEADIIDTTSSSVNACRLNYRLQSTLELEELMGIFADEVRRLLEVEAVRFRPDRAEAELAYGEVPEAAGRPGLRVDYPLWLVNEYLGRVSFHCRRMLTPDEVGRLGRLVTALLYPLRNTLLFDRARGAVA